MEIRLLALDLDGTALRSDNTLSPAVKRAIEKAAENGITVAAASGRPYGSMPGEVLEISGLDYAIVSNGAAIYDKNGKRISSTPLRESHVLRLLELTEKYDLIWEAFCEGEICTDQRYYNNPLLYGCSEAYVDYVKSSRGRSDNMREYIYTNRSRLDSVEFVCPDGVLREKIRAELKKELDGVYITSSSRNFVEFMDGRATKANALKKLCAGLGLDLGSAAACGNAENDVDMILAAGVGAAVENASSLCLSAADIIVPSNDSDGVAKLIEIITTGEYKK